MIVFVLAVGCFRVDGGGETGLRQPWHPTAYGD